MSMSKRGNGHQVPARVRQREDKRGEDVKASRSKQALARQAAKFAERAGRDNLMGQAPPEQHVAEPVVARKAVPRGKSPPLHVAETRQVSTTSASGDASPRYLFDDARKLVGLAFDVALWPLRQARAIVRHILPRRDITPV
jgi:hypothetical protein